jgi:Tol biopolymer transport system component
MNLNQRNTARIGVGAGIALTMLAVTLLFNLMPAAAVQEPLLPFYNSAFERVWNRTDSIAGQVHRTYFWGPLRVPPVYFPEEYVDAPAGYGGLRQVQYFDKSRMELNDPNADPNSPFYVTNGLLTVELISGRIQIGNNTFRNSSPANIPIAGNDDQAPTYASFISVTNTGLGDHPQISRVGMTVTQMIDKLGHVSQGPSRDNLPGQPARIAYYEPTTGHNIPKAFWDFLNARGSISQTGQIVEQRLIDPWFYASGLPISDAYWTRVKIGSNPIQDVMIQAFERRVLTYNPLNNPEFQVEMGNIGQHYYDWRYKNVGKPTSTPTPKETASTPVATSTARPATATVIATPTTSPAPDVTTNGYVIFTSNRSGKKQMWRVKPDSSLAAESINPGPLAGSDNDYAVYSPDGFKIAFTSNFGGNEEIWVMNADGSLPQRLTNNAARDYKPVWSPDGSKIAFVSTRDGGQEDIWVMDAGATNPMNITVSPGIDTDPSWAKDLIVFTSRRSGSSQIYTVNPNSAALPIKLTTDGENSLPRWNHQGNRIVFISNRSPHLGNQEIYTMRPGGEEQKRLTNNAFPDWDPAYAYNDSGIVFSEDLGSSLKLYTMNIDGRNQLQITGGPGKDSHPDWRRP